MGRGLCNTHYSQWRRGKEPGPGRRSVAETAEEARFLAAAGETVENIARRLGYTRTDSLHHALRRADPEFAAELAAQGIEEAKWLRTMAS